MKRLLLPAALVLSSALALTACGGGDTVDEAGDAATAPTAEAEAPADAEASPEVSPEAGDADGTPVAGDEAADPAVPTAGTPPTPDATVVALAAAFEPPLLGDPDAPIQIFEFSDYRCPYCRSFYAETLPGVIENYIDTGKVALTFIDFPLPSHGYPAVLAAELAHCAGEQDRYWEMHDRIFEAFGPLNDVDLEDEEAAMAGVWAVAEEADDLGLDMAALDACYTSHKYRPIIAALVEQARDSGVEATPTLLIVNAGQDFQEGIPGFLAYEPFSAILDREWSRHLGTPIPTAAPAPTLPPTAPLPTPDLSVGGDG